MEIRLALGVDIDRRMTISKFMAERGVDDPTALS